MNAVREVLPPVNDTVLHQEVAQPLNPAHCTGERVADPRRAIAERYPTGLISEAELEALLGITNV
jgi:hypothetical protein